MHLVATSSDYRIYLNILVKTFSSMYSYMVSMHACMQDKANYDRKMQLIRVVEMKTVQYLASRLYTFTFLCCTDIGI